ncbi:MAG: phosphate regulon sensor histidine kinase PhoR [Gammaproteobacteria bacterium]
MPKRWTIELWRIALVVAPAALLGAWFGVAGWLVAGALTGLLGWHLLQLRRLARWLPAGGAREPSVANGVWRQLADDIARLRQGNRKRKQTLTALLGRFRESAAAMPDAVVIIGPYGEIEWFNDAATRLLDLRPRQDIGRRLTHLVRHPAFTAYLATGEYGEPVEFPSPVSEHLFLSARAVPYGKNQLLVTVRDVTRMHRLEAMRRDFVANVSHELRTPLTVITGYLETFSDDEQVRASETTARTVQQMEEQAERMRRLVEDLLMLSRLETTPATAEEARAVSVASLVADIVAEARVLSRAQGNAIRADCDATMWLKGNAKELYSAFLNLVSNAIRYSPAGGDVTLRWYADDEAAYFVVRDQGIGIEPQHIPRITERFYRVDKDRSRGSGGTGLGLAIVKHVLQRHGARLRVDSQPGKGSVFTCIFPRARIEHRPSKPKAVGGLTAP